MEDPDGRLEDIRSYGWGYPWQCWLRDPTDGDAVMALVNATYE